MGLLQQPEPLGYPRAARDTHTVAAPLLAGAALALAGVVAGADDKNFRWSGVSLLVLVAAAMALIASIELHQYSHQYLYSRQDIHDWYEIDPANTALKAKLYEHQGDDYARWTKYNDRAVACFRMGTAVLGAGIITCVIPPEGGQQAIWRWAAAGLVFLCFVAEALWAVSIYRELKILRQIRGVLRSAVAKPRESE
jgi:hypothetical protein